MDDLIGLIAFVVIAAVNLLAQANKKKKQKERLEGVEPQPESKPSPFESFFENLAEKLEPQPQPIPLPDWPEELERPDYKQEMADYEVEPEHEEPVAQIIPMPEPIMHDAHVMQGVKKSAAFQAPPQVASSVFAGTTNIRLPSVPLMRSNARGHIDFNLKDRKTLKQAIVANIIFSQPRACDCSFDNTLAK